MRQRRHVRFGSKTDICNALDDVRFTPESGHHYAVRSTRVSISLRSIPKSIGLVNNASAPASNALRLVSASPYAVIMMIGTSGRAALALGSNSRPVIPGILMSDSIKMIETSAASLMRRVAGLGKLHRETTRSKITTELLSKQHLDVGLVINHKNEKFHARPASFSLARKMT